MFYVKSKKLETIKVCDEISSFQRTQKVYAVQYKKGYPFFLLYENNQWVTKSAKHYEPISE